MSFTLQALEEYLVDCENKRRRARDRPSNRVIEELRALVDEYRGAPASPQGPDSGVEPRADPADPGEEPGARVH